MRRTGLDLSDTFDDFALAPRSAIIAAVSGGSDSTALLLLLHDHLARKAEGTRLVAVTVDHALRPESAAEAEAVGALCRTHGITHRILRWTDGKPATGLIAAAREARYRLLAEAAVSEGTDLVLAGHTADDQAETVAMRKARTGEESDARGLAGMAPATLYDGCVWILRPLLGATRQQLRDYLRTCGIAWIDDPTNANPAYERPRIRASLQGSGAPGVSVQTVRQAARRRMELGEAAAGLIRAQARLVAPGLVMLDRPFPTSADRDAALYAFRGMLATVGGREHLPDSDAAGILLNRLADPLLRATLSRTVADDRKAGIFLYRGRRGLPPPMEARAGMIWDGRIRIAEDCEGMEIGPSAYTDQVEEIELAPPSLVRAAGATEPEFRRSAPSSVYGGGPKGRRAHGLIPIVAPWARFLSAFDLAIAAALGDLLGAPAIPPSPWRGHIDG